MQFYMMYLDTLGNQSITCAFFLLFSVFALGGYWLNRCVHTLDRWADWWSLTGPYDKSKYTGSGTYNTGNTGNTRTIANGAAYKPKKPTEVRMSVWDGWTKPSLLAGERKAPPTALFFGREAGEEIKSQGLYEENYLNSFEKSHWEWRKAKDPDLKAASVHEMPNDANFGEI
jgi:hypothetical protein